MAGKKTAGEKLFDFVNTLILLLLSVIMFYPFWHELCLSFSSATEATRGGMFLLPRDPTLNAYQIVMRQSYVWSSYLNSTIVTVLSTGIGLLFTSMMSYGLSKKRVRGMKLLSFLVLFCMIFNGGLIPTYLILNAYGLINSLWALILPTAVLPYNLIIMKNFFSSMSEDLEEAARIDGAGTLRIFFTIVLPLSKAVLATIGLWLAVAAWNNFQGALIYLNDQEKFTLPLYIRQVIEGILLAKAIGEGAQTAVESVVGATIILSVIPILCVYPYLQKYFVKGVMIGSVKG